MKVRKEETKKERLPSRFRLTTEGTDARRNFKRGGGTFMSKSLCKGSTPVMIRSLAPLMHF